MKRDCRFVAGATPELTIRDLTANRGHLRKGEFTKPETWALMAQMDTGGTTMIPGSCHDGCGSGSFRNEWS
jgi:hypothetical protein